MMNFVRKILKSLGVLVGVILIGGLILYTWWLQPYFTALNMGQISFESEDIMSKGFPFETVLHIKQPRIYHNQNPFWIGEEMRLEWSLKTPTRITIHLHGQHVISANISPNMKAMLQLRDTTGYVHLESLRQMQLDIKGEDISITLPTGTGQGAPFIVNKLYMFYDGPTSLAGEGQAGDLHFSAENIIVPDYMNPPFSTPIERLDFKAIHNEGDNTHDIKNIVIFWDALRAAGNGTLYHEGNANKGDFIMAIQGMEALIGGMYKAGRFRPEQIHQAVRAVTNIRIQQQRGRDDPVYLPVLYENNIIQIAGIPFYKVRHAQDAQDQLQHLLTSGGL